MRVRVKICGLTDSRSVEAAADAGADAVGFVFADSPRKIEPQRAAELAEALPPFMARVAVMRHPEAVYAAQVLHHFCADWLQTDRQDFAALEVPSCCRPLPVLRDGDVAAEVPKFFVYEGAVSGSGRTANWSAARTLATRGHLILAGGLDPDNVGEAIRQVQPWGVDVSSGVESARGVKDPARIRAFMEAVQAAQSEENGR